MIYAGIGSRLTPPEVLASMATIAANLAHEGWLLRSGHADGADMAFERGCDEHDFDYCDGGSKEIWLPWKGFNGSKSEFILSPSGTVQHDRAMAIASCIHPAWDRCTYTAKMLHARNVLQILGSDFETPVDRVICWTPNAAVVGGTATALRLAQQYDIEIVNLANDPKM